MHVCVNQHLLVYIEPMACVHILFQWQPQCRLCAPVHWQNHHSINRMPFVYNCLMTLNTILDHDDQCLPKMVLLGVASYIIIWLMQFYGSVCFDDTNSKAKCTLKVNFCGLESNIISKKDNVDQLNEAELLLNQSCCSLHNFVINRWQHYVNLIRNINIILAPSQWVACHAHGRATPKAYWACDFH